MYTQQMQTGAATFDLRSSLVVLRRRKWTLIAVVLLVLAIGAFFSFRKTPVYEATATALLKADVADSVLSEQLSSDPERRVQNEAVLIDSARTRSAVRDELGFSGSVSVDAGGEDDVLAITASDSDPERAALIANTYARTHAKLRLEDNREAVLNAKREVASSLTDLNATAATNAQQGDALTAQRQATEDPVQAAQLDQQLSEISFQRQALLSQISASTEQLSQLQTQQGLIDSRPPVEILAPANTPSSPISPNHRQDLVIVLAFGVILGIGVVFVQEHLDDTIRVLADLDQAAPGIDSLAVIPFHPGSPDRSILTSTQPMSHTAESFRSLRTSVEFLALDKPLKTIQITSAQAGEGKTTCVVNLAVAFAQADERVVIVDCDLRRPRVDKYFGLDRHIGLTSVLLHERRLEDVIRSAPDLPNLHVLCAGPLAPNPSELLGSDDLRDALHALTRDYSIVLLDSPPVLPVTDAMVLSRSADATIVLVSSGVSSKRRVKRSVETLRQIGAPLVGTVLNKAPHEVAYGYVDYGYVAYGPSSGGKYSFANGRSQRLSPKSQKDT